MPKLFFASDCGWILIVITQFGVYFIPPVLSKLMESKGWSHVKNSRAAGRPVTLWLVSVCNYIIWSSHQLGPGCSQHPTSKCQLMNAVSLNTAAYVTAPTDNGLGARLLFVSMQSRKVSQNATTKYLMKLEATLYFMTGFILDRAYLWVPLVHFSRTLSLALLLCSSTPEHRQKHTSMKLLPLWMMIKTIALLIFLFFWGESVTVWSLECLKPPLRTAALLFEVSYFNGSCILISASYVLIEPGDSEHCPIESSNIYATGYLDESNTNWQEYKIFIRPSEAHLPRISLGSYLS